MGVHSNSLHVLCGSPFVGALEVWVPIIWGVPSLYNWYQSTVCITSSKSDPSPVRVGLGGWSVLTEFLDKSWMLRGFVWQPQIWVSGFLQMWFFSSAPSEGVQVIWMSCSRLGVGEVDRQIGVALAVMQTLQWSVKVKKELIWKVKLSIFWLIYIPTLSYGHELGVVKKTSFLSAHFWAGLKEMLLLCM